MRAIDIHEPSIVRVLDMVDAGLLPYMDAVSYESAYASLTVSRLDQLVRVWCGIAGIPAPTLPPADS